MPTEVIMPKVDMDMATGTLSVWHVAEGEAVTRGAALFDIETDKAAMEVESPASGRLHHILAQPGAVIAVGAPVAWIYAEGEAVGAVPGGAPAPAAPEAAPEAEAPPAASPAPAEAPAAPGGALRATPAARSLARQAGLDMAGIAGSGPAGRIQRADVAEALERPAAPEPAPEPAPARRTCAVPAATRAPVAETGPESWEAEGGELHVVTRKGTGRPLVFIHGFAADSMGWLPVEKELAPGRPLVRVDLPCHGRSPKQRIARFADLSRALTRALDAADLGPAHLVAHSLGGAVALAYADIRPRDVASLTLLAPAGLGPEIDGATLSGIARASRTESLAPWLQRLTATPEGISFDFARAAMLSRADPALRAAQIDMAEVLFPDGTQGFSLTAALARVTAPTAIIWGRADRIIPWRHALAATGEMALHLLPDVGHIPYVEAPGLVAEIIARQIALAER